MLSYKHGYHAGNQADVFKHICLIQAYKSLKKLNNSISYIDTHAGSGDYDFKSDYMSKNKEYEYGINKLENYKYENQSIKFYLKVLRNINNSKKLSFYPGSPSIMSYLSDNSDKLSFYELHNNEFLLLRKNLSKQINSKVFNKDGFDFTNKKINSKLAFNSILSGLVFGLLFFPSQNFQSSILVGNLISKNQFSLLITNNLLFISFIVSTIIPLLIILIYSFRNSLR